MVLYNGAKLGTLKKYFKLPKKSNKANRYYYKHCKLQNIFQKIKDFDCVCVCVCLLLLLLLLFVDSMLHYKVILHVAVVLVLYYVLLYNKIVLKISLLIPQDNELRSGRVQGLSSSILESL
jgi:hypothetical protein